MGSAALSAVLCVDTANPDVKIGDDPAAPAEKGHDVNVYRWWYYWDAGERDLKSMSNSCCHNTVLRKSSVPN